MRTTTKDTGETTAMQVSMYKPIGTLVGIMHGSSPGIGAKGAEAKCHASSSFHYIDLATHMSTMDTGETTATRLYLCANQMGTRTNSNITVGLNTHNKSKREVTPKEYIRRTKISCFCVSSKLGKHRIGCEDIR